MGYSLAHYCKHLKKVYRGEMSAQHDIQRPIKEKHVVNIAN